MFFSKVFTITQAQIDFQTQLEHTSSDLTTLPLFNDSPVLFLETMDQTQTKTNLPNTTEQTEHEHNTPKVPTPPDNTTETPPPPKKTLRNHERFSLSFITCISSYNTF